MLPVSFDAHTSVFNEENIGPSHRKIYVNYLRFYDIQHIVTAGVPNIVAFYFTN